MDPNANLAEQRRIINASKPSRADLERLADLVAALDQWITGGGNMPDAWRVAK